MPVEKYVSLMTSDLTQGERLYVFRHRRGHDIPTMAHKLRVSTYRYRLMERDKCEQGGTITDVGVGPMTPQEKCLVMKLRSKKTSAKVAKELGCSRMWLRMMENGEAEVARLQEYWKVR